MVPLQNNLILVRHLVLLQETAIAPQSKQGSLLHLHTFLPQLTDLGQTSLSGYYRKQELVITTKLYVHKLVALDLSLQRTDIMCMLC